MFTTAAFRFNFNNRSLYSLLRILTAQLHWSRRYCWLDSKYVTSRVSFGWLYHLLVYFKRKLGEQVWFSCGKSSAVYAKEHVYSNAYTQIEMSWDWQYRAVHITLSVFYENSPVIVWFL